MNTETLNHKLLRNKAVVAKGILCNDRGEILFVRAFDRPYLSLPGGICEQHESPTAALRRELQEEVNLVPADLELAGIQYEFDGEYDHVKIIFNCKKWEGEIRFNDQEIAEAVFLPLHEAAPQLKEGLYEKLRMWTTEYLRVAYLENGRLAG